MQRTSSRSLLGELSSLVDVPTKLLNQLADPGKAPRIAQAVHELDDERLADELALEAHQVDLDLARLFPKGRVRPDVRGPGPNPTLVMDADRINAVAWNDRLKSFEVRGRKAERRARPCPVPTMPRRR